MQPYTAPKDKRHQAADPAPHGADQWQDHLAKLSQYGEQLYQDYRQQAGICKELASAEWRLSTRSLALTIILLVSFAGGLVLLWAGLLITFGLAIFSFSQSIWLSAVCLISLQLLCLMWLWKNIGYISSKIGFDKTAHSIKQLLNINRGE
ncbi:hypothetical protein [Pseudoalteromonas ostreae]|uniref:hypothetical protein n=1 Tax=Pseudoalteromonas ostreae TaxID=2774154 RepID=UPI001B397681|nr:hypothetical protein [Pseudoalteromonas ostreae]